MIEAVIFDMDGVLLDSESLYYNIEVELMKGFGADISGEVTGEFLGMRFEEYFTIIKNRHGLTVSVEEMMEKHALLAGKYYREIFPPMPYVQEMLQSLHKKYPLAVVTSTHSVHAHAALGRLELLPFFKTLVCAEDVTQGKPHPEPYLKASQKLGIQPENIVVVEDAINGFKAAKKAGMQVIGYKSTHNTGQDFGGADMVITTLKEVVTFLERGALSRS